VVRYTHTPATLSLRKQPPIPNGKETGVSPRAGLDAMEKRKVCCSYWESKPPTLRPSNTKPTRYTDELFRLLVKYFVNLMGLNCIP
jgi:hypothetical protein